MITWPDLTLPPINLWTAPRMPMGGPKGEGETFNLTTDAEEET